MIEHGNWLIEFKEDYSQFFTECNWYTFHFAHIEFENDAMLGAWEATIVILGLGIRWRWTHTDTEMSEEIRKRHREFVESHLEGN